MTTATVSLELTTTTRLGREPTGATAWEAELFRSGSAGAQVVATASGRTFDHSHGGYSMYDALDDICQEYANLAFAVQESGLEGYHKPLFIIDLVVAPEWRGHNIGPHLLRWMAATMGDVAAVFLIPTPLPTVEAADGVWVSNWDLPRRGSGAMRKVRRAYRRGGFTHLHGGTWWTEIADVDAELERVRPVMAVLER